MPITKMPLPGHRLPTMKPHQWSPENSFITQAKFRLDVTISSKKLAGPLIILREQDVS